MRKKFFSLFLLSALLLLLDYFNFVNPVKAALEPSITGIKATIYSGFYRLKFMPSIIVDYPSLTSRNEERRKTEAENIAMKIKIESLEEENRGLRKQIGAPKPEGTRLIPADVIAVTRHMEINAGSDNGVVSGMAVVEGQSLIGRITEVTSRRSKVVLLTDTEISVPAISGRGARGIISGQLSEDVKFSQVLQKDPLFLGDTITTTGEENLPKDFLVGTVVHIDSDDVAVYKSAQVEPAVKPQLLKKVYVLDWT